MIYTPEQFERIQALLAELAQMQVPVTGVFVWLEERMAEATKQPTEDDRRWPLAEAESIDEHLGNQGDDRPALSCRVVVGRAYSLTPGQRDVIREWFNMTPAPLVEVLECAVYEGTKYIRRVTLRSCEHVDPRRKRVMVKFAIDKWGEFMSLAKQKDVERNEAKKLTDDILDEAKKGKVEKVSKTKVSLSELMNEYGV